MDFTYLFTSLQGRVSRAKWWAGESVLFFVFSALALIGNQTPIGHFLDQNCFASKSNAIGLYCLDDAIED